MWAISSVGRAPALQAGGHWFEPGIAHHSLSIFGIYFQTTQHCVVRIFAAESP